MSNDTVARKDSDNLARLERLRPTHEALQKRLIRAEAELEHGERDVEANRAALREGWGTDDLDEIRKIVRDNYEKNSRAVDEYEALITEIMKDVAAIDAGA